MGIVRGLLWQSPQKGGLIGFLPRKLKTAARRLQSGACKNIFMNSISVENFVGCLHPPFGSRVGGQGRCLKIT